MGPKKSKKRSKKKNVQYRKKGKGSSNGARPLSMDALSHGVQHHNAGRFQEAEAIYRRLIQENPENADAWHLLGVIASQRGDKDTAIELISRATAINPSNPLFYNNLGLVLQKVGRLDEGFEHFRTAVRLMPDYPEAHNNLGNALMKQGRMDEAIECYQKAINLRPDYGDAHNNLGNALMKQGRMDEAIECYQKALHLKPDFDQAQNNLGSALMGQGRLDEAIECYQKAIDLKPNYPLAYNNLGGVLLEQLRLDEAIEYYQKAIDLKPDYEDAHNNLGVALMDQGRIDEAIGCYQKAIDLKPDYSEAYNNLGGALKRQGRLDEAIECYRKSIDLETGCGEPYTNPGNALTARDSIDESIEKCHAGLKIKPGFSDAHSNLLQALLYHAVADARQIFSEHLSWAEQYASALASRGQAYCNDPSPDRPLTVGYVSPDFCRHSVAFFMEPVIAAHDRRYFRIICYANVARPDNVTRRFQCLADSWQNIYGMNDEQAARLIRKDGIDILIDLAGHTRKSRILLFARKPAPVQVAYLGYPNTTGLATMDYRLTDSWADPAGQTDEFYTEELVRLPHGFLCYQPPHDSPDVGSLPALETGRVTFGSFNNRMKITPEAVDLWSAILKAVPNAGLILKSTPLSDKKTCELLKERFLQNGIDPERIELLGHIPSPVDHLKLYNRIDIGLDTFPYNGTTTTCEALWMGVPVIALSGDSHASRVGMSILSNVGLPELIAESAEEYVQKAVQLANDPDRVSNLRANLRPMMAHSPLMDANGFTRSLEKAYREMWHRWIGETEARSQKSEVRSQRAEGRGQRAEGERQRSEVRGQRTEVRSQESDKLSVSEEAISINQQGEDLFNAGQIEAASTAFNKAIETEPELVVAHNNLGVLYWHLGDADKAIKCFNKALQIDPVNENSILNLNEVLQSLKQASEATQPSPSGLEIASQNVIIPDTNKTKPVIRVLHNMARSGGTIICKCLGCMKDVVLLSEIHPAGTKWFNPLDQARQWFNLLTTTDIELLQEKGIPFEDAIGLIYERCTEKNKSLIIRDWGHLDFTAIPFLKKPSFRLSTSEILSSEFTVKNTAIVRHPIDQWLSLTNLSLVNGKITLEEFLKGYLRFAEYCKKIGFIRYEDFTRSPEKEMEQLCERLSINYDPTFIENWWQYATITGDTNSQRGHRREIKPVPRREMEEGLLEQFERNPDYIKSIEILGYDHPPKTDGVSKKASVPRKGDEKLPEDVARANEVFIEFLKENKKFWDSFSPSPTELEDKVILVDCLVDFPPYILGNLIISKYLQKRTKAKIIGLVRDPAQLERQRHLLASFSVEEVIYANQDIQFDYKLNIDALIQEKDVKKLRKMILDFSIDGLKVGDLIYDAYLRDTGLPTINSVDETLKVYFHQAMKYYGVYSTIFKKHDVIATVQGHTVYLLYGMLAHVAVKNGAVVFGRKPGSSPMAIRRYSKLSDLRRYEIGFKKEDFRLVYGNKTQEAIRFAKTFLNNRFEGRNTHGTVPYIPKSFGPDKKKYGVEELSGKLNLDPYKPVVFLMCHAFSDASHYDDRMIHNDYFEWLEDTLEIVANLLHVNWIVKPHPEDKYFLGKEDFALSVAKKYAKKHDHIFLAPEDLNTSCMLGISDAIITVRGTAALEFSAMGIPCVVTGKSSFTSLGFTIEPKDREEYMKVLQNIEDYGKLSKEQIKKALTCCYCYFYLDLVDCAFIPSVSANWWTRFNAEKFWTDALSAIGNHSVKNDPLYQNFNLQIQNDLPHLMKFDELPTLSIE